ncbi:MAG TPA: ABC transporter permease [Tepidisphaeraceae bacterium]|nr:ABC transporter permease [Tepidisphaeraceae bacterium]
MKKDLGITMLLLVLCGIAYYLNPVFLSRYNLQNTARLIGMYGIFSIGLGIVIITGGIDLSVGSVFALQGVLLAVMLRGGTLTLVPAMRFTDTLQLHTFVLHMPQLPWILAILISMAAVLLLGLFHAILIVKFKMQPFIVTLCGLMFYRSIARFMVDDNTVGFGESEYGILRTITTHNLEIPWPGNPIAIPMPFVILMIVAIIGAVVVHKSVYGRYLFAVGRNENAARYSGINSRLIVGSAYVLCMLLSGIAGIVLSLDTNSISPSDFGNSYELYGIAAAVLGGCSLRGGEGSVFGIVIGTALLQVLQNIVNLVGIPSSLNGSVMGAVILVGVLVDQILATRKKARVSKTPPPLAKTPIVPPAATA